MSYTVPVVSAVIVAVLAGVVYTTQRSAEPEDSELSLSAASDEPSRDDAHITQDLVDEASNAANDLPSVISESAELSDSQTLPLSETGDSSAAAAQGTSVTDAIDFARSIAQSGMDEATLSAHTKAMREDPALLAAVLDEFSAETDVKRLSRIRLLLGQLDDDSLVGVAESMVFSGNPASADAALDLLRDIGPRVPAARDIALDVMASTQDANLLVGATSVMVGGGAKDPEMIQRVVTSLSSLVQHPDAKVRRASFSALARWSNDASVTPTLLQGLNDDDPAVRKSTAYGFVGYPHTDTSVIAALLQTAENPNDTPRTRKGAVLALKGMPLDDSQRARLQAVEAQLN